MEVTLVFELDEEVTPLIFAQRVMDACARFGALRPGESVRPLGERVRFVVPYSNPAVQSLFDRLMDDVRNRER